MRIVSLLASATEIVCELGLEDSLVGISHECDHPERVLDRPRVSRPRFDPEQLSSREIDQAVRQSMAEHGSVYAVDRERLASLEPDLILTQGVCEVCAVPTPGVWEAVEELDLDTRVLSLDAHDLEGILETVLEVGEAAGSGERAEALVAGYRRRLDRVRRSVADSGRPRVLAIEWLDPPFEPGHWVPEMVEIAGGENLAGEADARSTRVEWNDLTGLDPDVLVVMPCGYGLEESRQEADACADRLAEAAPRAIEEGRAWVVDASSYFNRSGPRVVDGVEILAALLHPERAGEPPGAAAARWEPEEATVTGRPPDGS